MLVIGGSAAGQSLSADLNGDGVAEFVTLERGDVAVLTILEADGTIIAPDITWPGGSQDIAELTVTARGSLQVKTANEAVGRGRWYLTTTIAWRSGRFVVAGITYDAVDTIDPGLNISCDINLLTGQGLRKGRNGQQELRSDLRSVPIEDWASENVLKVCAL